MKRRTNPLNAAVMAVVMTLAALPVASNTFAQQSAVSSTKAQKSADRELSRQVRRALVKEMGTTGAQDILLRVKHGRVDITGSVPDGDQIALASNTAGKVPGVKAVNNYLRIRETGH